MASETSETEKLHDGAYAARASCGTVFKLTCGWRSLVHRIHVSKLVLHQSGLWKMFPSWGSFRGGCSLQTCSARLGHSFSSITNGSSLLPFLFLLVFKALQSLFDC